MSPSMTIASLYEAAERAAAAGKTFVQYARERFGYADLLREAGQWTAIFRRHGLAPGDRIIVASDEDEAVISLTCAALFNGLCTVPLSADTAEPRARALMERARPRLIVADAARQERWRPAGAPVLAIAPRQEAPSLMGRLLGRQAGGYRALLAGESGERPLLAHDERHPLFILFTSGTTRAPKGVQLSRRNLFSHLQTLGRVYGYDEHSRILNNMMLVHADGLLQGPVLTLCHNATLYRPCPMDVQHLDTLLNTPYNERITHFITVPTVLSFIDRFATHDDYFHGDHFRHLISVAGMLDSAIWARMERRFGVRINNMYGLTETVAGGLFCGPGDDHYRLGTVGKPIDMDHLIVDDAMQPLPPGSQGELLLKGDNVFMGYVDAATETAAAFHDGWFRTGDIVSEDPEGFIHIHGRKKELVVSGGYNIHPAEVNEALLRHPAVAEAATFGLPDPEWQEIVVSAVVLNPGTRFDETALIEHCRAFLEPRKIPKRLLAVEALPRGPSGKVIIPALANLVSAAVADTGATHGQDDPAELIALAAQVFRTDPAQLSLAEPAERVPSWDSLAHLTLVSTVEQHYGLTLSVSEIIAIRSLQDLWQLIRERR